MGIHSEDYWRRLLPPEMARKVAGRWVIGDKIAHRCRIIQILGGPGKSGMGIVYICYDDKENEIVAIKTLQNRFIEDPAIIDRFKWEAETWVRLGKHYNIVEAKRVENHGEKPYIYLEYVLGDKQYGSGLSGWIHNGGLYQNGKPAIPLILDFAIQFCHGMMHAEKKFQEMGKPFVHRDIKPSNILVTRDKVVKITDFGLVKAFADLDEDIATATVGDGVNRRLSLSKSGSICGTPPYMSPEQCQGSKDIDIRSDIYAFGCVLYEMLTRRLVFDGMTMDEFIRHHLKTKPRSPKVWPDLDTVVMKCLEKRPANRYADFKEMERALSKIYRELTGEEVKEPDVVPVDSGDLNNKGLSLVNLGFLEEAVSCYQEALRINPNDDWAHINLGNTYKAQGKLDEAISEYRVAGAHVHLMNAYAAQGKLDEAIREHQEILKLNPDNIWTHKDMGDVYKAQGKLDEAIREYQEALRIKPDSSAIHSALGHAYEAQGKLDEAIREYQEVLRIEPDSSFTHYNMGGVYKTQEKLNEAAREYREELRIQPDHDWLHFDLGKVYQAQGKFDEAVREYREELRIKNLPYVHLTLGDVYKAQGKLDEAISEYRVALRIAWDHAADYANAHNALGDAYEAQGKLDGAIAEYREALRIDHSLADAHFNLGRAYKAQGKFREAIECYEKFIELATPQDASRVRQAEEAIRELKQRM